MSVRDDVPPWSFFIPVTLAVIVGALAADAIRHAIGIVFGRGEVTAQAGGDDAADAADATDDAEPAPAAPPVEPAPAAASRTGSAAGDTAGAGEPSRRDGVLELPDSMSARRDGAPAACVNGTVVNRVPGGWEQLVEGNATVPCVIVNR